MNAFNMVDGINGLCSSLSALIFLYLGIFYNGFIGTQLIYALGAICGFLIFNLEIVGRKRLVFLGDHGSNLLGFTAAFALISSSQNPFFDFKPVTALWFVAIPLFDCLGLIFKRIYRGVGPFDADRDHLHHRFMDAEYSPRQTLIIIIIFSVILSLIGILLQKYANEFISLILFLFFSSIFYYFSYLLKKYAIKLKQKNV
jgi:UDP-GlcNAc:undecaprenyl-phosphate GlcNAc-1-phosphate transferase